MTSSEMKIACRLAHRKEYFDYLAAKNAEWNHPICFCDCTSEQQFTAEAVPDQSTNTKAKANTGVAANNKENDVTIFFLGGVDDLDSPTEDGIEDLDLPVESVHDFITKVRNAVKSDPEKIVDPEMPFHTSLLYRFLTHVEEAKPGDSYNTDLRNCFKEYVQKDLDISLDYMEMEIRAALKKKQDK